MNILVVNDDGWGAKGLMTLLPYILPLGKVTVLVPDGPRSGMSNAVTATHPISLCKMEQDGFDLYLTNGTPSDCVKLAINVLFKGDERAIDLVISGINHGSNAAINQIYSGTMGACFVAAEHDIPSIGLSIDDMSAEPDFSFMEPYIPQVIQHLLDTGMQGLCYNINAPKGKINGIKWTRQSRSHWTDEMAPVSLENGETGYKLAGYLVNDEPEATDTDLWALEHGYISIQPCKVDMTNYGAL
ncbi:MAG: 5'/3'-nucleotidase SurE [Paludibacteraceae bacterium]|nr:5'/3'-nucleotidase SurE [Paludibacteraceae bacterium]